MSLARSRNRGRASSSRWISSAHTSARVSRLILTTRAAVISAIAATAASSALRMTTPDGGIACGSSAFVTAIASREPNSPRCAVPTLSTTATDGGAIAASSAMLPGRRADISSTRKSVSDVARSTVHGWPSSLLNDPGGATTSPRGASTAAIRSLVDVLPDEPVMPTIVSPPATSSAATNDASRASPASTAAPDPSVSCSRTLATESVLRGLTTIAGTPTGRAATTATAPACTAALAWSCPSARAPGSARNRPPGVILRESNSTVPVTCSRAASAAETSASSPPTISAIWATVKSITRWRLSRPAPQPVPRGRRTGG